MGTPTTARMLKLGAVASTLLTAAAVASIWMLRQPERHLAEAARLADSGDLASALGWLAIPEADRSTRDRALLLHARIAVEGGKPGEAVGPINGVDAAGPHVADADFWKGRALYAAGNPNAALLWFRSALARRPGDVEALRWVAAAAYDLGDWPAAVLALSELTRLRPDDSPAWRTLGVLYNEENKFDEAARSFEASLASRPDQPAVRLELAGVHIRRGASKDAERQLRRCAGEVPEDDRVALLSDSLRARGDSSSAAALIAGALAKSPAHAGLLGRAAAIDQEAKRDLEAVAKLDKALEIDPYNAEFFYRRGRSLRILGMTAESERDSARAEELNRVIRDISAMNKEVVRRPDDAGIRSRLGGLCALGGKFDMADYWYRSALACDPADVEALAGLRTLRGGRRPAINPSN